LVRRFRGATKGVVRYAGPLLALLDVPSVTALENRLAAAVARAEARGHRLESILREFDADGDGYLSLAELREALTLLRAFEGLPEPHVRRLLKRFDTDGDGSISLLELLTWAGREYRPAAALESRVRKLILKAEAAGVCVEEAFGEMDKDGSGQLTAAEFEAALDALGVLNQLQHGDAAALAKRLDRDGDGTVSLPEFMQRVLFKAEQGGVCLEEAFGVWDADGSGHITTAEMEKGLRQLG
ncbi:unnamed protein product, partial [Phaeothamnion confervicola]